MPPPAIPRRGEPAGARGPKKKRRVRRPPRSRAGAAAGGGGSAACFFLVGVDPPAAQRAHPRGVRRDLRKDACGFEVFSEPFELVLKSAEPGGSRRGEAKRTGRARRGRATARGGGGAFAPAPPKEGKEDENRNHGGNDESLPEPGRRRVACHGVKKEAGCAEKKKEQWRKGRRASAAAGSLQCSRPLRPPGPTGTFAPALAPLFLRDGTLSKKKRLGSNAIMMHFDPYAPVSRLIEACEGPTGGGAEERPELLGAKNVGPTTLANLRALLEKGGWHSGDWSAPPSEKPSSEKSSSEKSSRQSRQAEPSRQSRRAQPPGKPERAVQPRASSRRKSSQRESSRRESSRPGRLR